MRNKVGGGVGLVAVTVAIVGPPLLALTLRPHEQPSRVGMNRIEAMAEMHGADKDSSSSSIGLGEDERTGDKLPRSWGFDEIAKQTPPYGASLAPPDRAGRSRGWDRGQRFDDQRRKQHGQRAGD